MLEEQNEVKKHNFSNAIKSEFAQKRKRKISDTRIQKMSQ